eukprot:671341-Pyramimonas_sp.AAC.1
MSRALSISRASGLAPVVVVVRSSSFGHESTRWFAREEGTGDSLGGAGCQPWPDHLRGATSLPSTKLSRDRDAQYCPSRRRAYSTQTATMRR